MYHHRRLCAYRVRSLARLHKSRSRSGRWSWYTNLDDSLKNGIVGAGAFLVFYLFPALDRRNTMLQTQLEHSRANNQQLCGALDNGFKTIKPVRETIVFVPCACGGSAGAGGAGTQAGDSTEEARKTEEAPNSAEDAIYIDNLTKRWEKLQMATRVIVQSARSYGQRAVLKSAQYTGANAIAGRHTPGIYINFAKIWEKLQMAARSYGQRVVLKFAQYTGANAIAGRHTPGTFTNQMQTSFSEPRLLILTDPRTDHQPIKEAAMGNIPTIAFCNTDSPTSFVNTIPQGHKWDVMLGSTAIGLKTKEGVVLAVKKRITSPLLEPSSVEKIMEIDDHIGCAMSGLIADARTLVELARVETQDLTLAEAETIALSILEQVMEEKVTPNNVDIAKVAPAYHLYTPSEVEAVINRL